jgi:murein DD-endopeptidase MepM/ murein hydrolase activator NlpD
MSGFGSEKKGSVFKKLVITILLLFSILVISYVAYKLFFMPEPVVTGIEAFEVISSDSAVTLEVKNIRSIDVSIRQGDKHIDLLRDVTDSSEKTYTIQIKPKELQLKDGAAKVSIVAKAGFFKEIPYEVDSIIDTVPPSLEILKSPYAVHQGGSGFIALKARDASSVFVKLGDYEFRGFRADAHEGDSPAEQGFGIPSYQMPAVVYYVFFPVPIDVSDDSVLYAIAEDRAGNRRVRAARTDIKAKEFRSSSINITDSFINTVVISLLNLTETSDPVGSFRQVNEKWRADGIAKLAEISKVTEPEIFWEGRFLQLRNSKVMARYGDKRDYFYNGEKISESVHLGFDLASTPNAIVEAANTGIIRFAGDIGVYGNTVVIDHGMGLMSLYSHLSDIMVREGEAVKKGAVIGRTGSTGFAGGDHLHFGIMIHGHEVSPLYWWDNRWLRTNILDYLEKEG